MKLQKAQRIVRERDKIKSDMATLDAERAKAEHKIAGYVTTREAINVERDNLTEEHDRHRAASVATDKRHEAERQWLADKHAGENGEIQRAVDMAAYHLAAVDARAKEADTELRLAGDTINGFAPARELLEKQLGKLASDLPDAEAKVALVEASEAARKAAEPPPQAPAVPTAPKAPTKLLRTDGTTHGIALARASKAGRRRMLRSVNWR